ncbi:MFS transporter [uncultured Endozoicomonas sp.]|uniref:MFS transporter n=1 Tax=uncultured Endozoicomonas sp. TaxID=432652 RepID=UPI0026104733|nr:MFS transporter [uncultured Endozoicomonas sp.]
MTMTGRPLLALMLAASFASTIGGLPFNALPILLGSLADTFQLTPSQAGFLGSACFTGYLTGTFAAFFLMKHTSLKKLTIVSAVIIATLLFLSSIAGWQFQMLLWSALGFFAGLMTCLGLHIMGEMANKERALGLRQGVELGVTALVLFLLPAYVTATYGYQGTALTLLAIVLLLGISAIVLPEKVSASVEPFSFRKQLKMPPVVWLAVFTFFIFGAGNIGLWAFLERMGNSLNLAPNEQGIVFAVLKLLGGAAAFSVAIVGNRLGRWLPYLIVFAVLNGGLALLWYANGFLPFAMGAWIWEVGFTWGCVYMTAMIAQLDSQGRAIMLIPAAFALSSMVGPAVAGMLIETSFVPLLMFAALSTICAIFIFTTILPSALTKARDDSGSSEPELVS